MRELMVLATAAVLLAACSGPQVEVFPSPDPSLGARASATATTPGPRVTRSAPEGSGSVSPSDGPSAAPSVPEAGGQEPPLDDPSPAPEPDVLARFRPVGGINDPQGDIPRGAPPWTDIIGLVLEDDGTTLRIRVDLADELPEGLRNDEAARVGVDFFRGDDGGPRYRVFVDGSREGWLAYLQRSDGFVDYPGAVTMSGSQIVLAFPAAAIGDPVQGDWRAFSDWSGPGGGREAHDAAPDEGWGTFAR